MTAPAGPRLPPLAADGWTAEDRARLRGRVAVADRYLTGRADAPPMPGILGLLGHHPRLAANWLALSGDLLDHPVLDPRDRELLILRVAWRTQSHYEWAQHSRMALAAGLTEAEVAATAGSLAGAPWSGRDRSLLQAADQMVVSHQVEDATWSELSGQFDPEQLLELLFVIGTYLCLAVVLNSAGLLPDTRADGVAARLPEPEGA